MKTALAASLALGTLVALAAPAGAQSAPANCALAKANIDWVLTQNMNYRQTFTQGIGSGLTPFDAMLYADRQFPQVEASLRACADWAKDYLRSQGFAAAK